MAKSPARSESETAKLLAERIDTLMHKLYMRMTGDSMRVMNDAGITLPQMVTLQILRWGGPSSIGGLVEKLELSVSATSHLVDRLVEKGFVDRREDPSDRRQKRVEITPTGAELIEYVANKRNEEFTTSLQSLDPELRAQMVSVIDNAIEQLDQSNPYCKKP